MVHLACVASSGSSVASILFGHVLIDLNQQENKTRTDARISHAGEEFGMVGFGAAERTRTSTGCPTATSTLRVYQFRHGRTPRLGPYTGDSADCEAKSPPYMQWNVRTPSRRMGHQPGTGAL